MQRPSSARRGLAIALGIAALLVAAIAVSRTPPHAPALHGRPAPPSAARRGPALLIASSVSDAADAGQIARIERLALGDGDAEPHVEVIEDPRSSVHHIALCDPEVPGAILAAAGGEAALVRWRRSATGAWRSEDLWRTTFGPVSSRMRDVALVDGAALGRPPGWWAVGKSVFGGEIVA